MPTVRATTNYKRAGANIYTQSRVKAKMVQYTGYGERSFTFPFAPVEISYSGVARTYTEINRPGDFPLIESTGPQLLKAQLQFRVADTVTNGCASIEGQLNNLRLMGLLPGLVRVFNLDAYLSRPIAPTASYYGFPLAFFRITDLSVTVKRRNQMNEATQADVQITLSEDRNPYVPVVSLPPINYIDTPSRVAGGSSTSVGAPQAAPRPVGKFTDFDGV